MRFCYCYASCSWEPTRLNPGHATGEDDGVAVPEAEAKPGEGQIAKLFLLGLPTLLLLLRVPLSLTSVAPPDINGAAVAAAIQR